MTKRTDKKQILIEWLLDIAATARFFSRLPIPQLHAQDNPAARPDFSRSPRAVAFAGLILSLPAVLVLLVFSLSTLPALVVATGAVLCMTMVTGGLHEDGLADCADGFFGGQSPTQRLEIMKDSRVGSFGVLALVFSILLKVGLLAALLTQSGPLAGILALIAMAASSRAVSLWPWLLLPPARPGGLAERYGSPSASVVLQANLVATLLCLPLLIRFSFAQIILALSCALIASLIAGQLARTKVGGHTGDVIGAAQQLGELGFLIGLLLIAGHV